MHRTAPRSVTTRFFPPPAWPRNTLALAIARVLYGEDTR